MAKSRQLSADLKKTIIDSGMFLEAINKQMIWR